MKPGGIKCYRIHRAAPFVLNGFDPPTLGHLWMIRQAQSMFDELIVAIGINPDKRNTYTAAERQDMLCAVPTTSQTSG